MNTTANQYDESNVVKKSLNYVALHNRNEYTALQQDYLTHSMTRN